MIQETSKLITVAPRDSSDKFKDRKKEKHHPIFDFVWKTHQTQLEHSFGDASRLAAALRIEEGLSDCRCVTKVDLSQHSSILYEPLPPEFFNLHITELNLSDSNLGVLPEALFTMTSLKVLIVSHAFLVNISDNITRLRDLETIDLQDNLFNESARISLLQNLLTLPKLKNIILHEDEEFFQLLQEERPKVDKALKKVWAVVKPQLERDEALAKVIPDDERLRSLFNFDNPKASEINYFFQYCMENSLVCNEITRLDLTGLGLKIFPKILSCCFGQIRILDLSNNEFTNLTIDLSVFNRLRGLDLRGNPIETADQDLIRAKYGTVVQEIRFPEMLRQKTRTCVIL